ncbi:ABC transporter ATP-binding protein [Pseudalkalibacillus berkeleyi]|uniref:ABC transporter ATP-binding protein n=1 Tax=Pseudalkalibacillus berkeleyi TaxID=1069813 RepID=A0ABS9GV69_9BACL|nr:ABC transporter ATP-binding protein [Pseudalkalibacillus berkeleyi]MCF6136722.1 ABC transporter ATP-binding protein [Pseudalkalibacillus berkeleyi]
MVIQITDLTKAFGKTTVIQKTSLSIEKGEIFGMLGPSGAGKTTLVKMIAGIEKPSSGEMVIFDQKMPSAEPIQKIGYMAQTDGLYHDLTGEENLSFFSAMYHLKGKKRQERISHVLSLVNLTEHKRKLVRNYSGGMMRRLSLAVALLHEPDLIVLDEPTVGIDPVLRQSIWEELYKLKEMGMTILVTTHVMDEAEKCDRLAMMREGSIIAVGSPAELKKETETETIEQAFLHYGGGVQHAH